MTGADVASETLASLLAADGTVWAGEAKRNREYIDGLSDHRPPALIRQQDAPEQRISADAA